MTKTIQAARVYMRFSREEFSEFLKDRYGVLYPDDLTPGQIEDLLAFLRLMGFGKAKKKWTCTLCKPRQRDGSKREPVSPSQRALLQTLSDRVLWGQETTFKTWLKRYFGITDITTGGDASIIIVALKGLIRSQKGNCRGCTWRFDIGVSGGSVP